MQVSTYNNHFNVILSIRWREDVQFVDSSSETAVTQSSDHTTTLGNPGVTSSNSDSTDTQQAEVTFEFLLVTGGVDHFTLVAVGVLFPMIFHLFI